MGTNINALERLVLASFMAEEFGNDALSFAKNEMIKPEWFSSIALKDLANEIFKRANNGDAFNSNLLFQCYNAPDTKSLIGSLDEESPISISIAKGYIKQFVEAKRKQDLENTLRQVEYEINNGSYEAASIAEKAMNALTPIARPPSSSIKIISLADAPSFDASKAKEVEIFTNGYLRRGNTLLLIASSGIGKSTWTIQASLRWALGLDAFGIKPIKPLKIGIIQAEDDIEEMGYFRDAIIKDLIQEGGLRECECKEAVSRIDLFQFIGLNGDEFIDKVVEPYANNYDLLIINPLLSYIGGDVASLECASHFFREKLDPAIKNKCAVLIVHHTTKPPQAKDRNASSNYEYEQYSGAGSHDITNYARAILTIKPIPNASGHFYLIGAKRGKRLYWQDMGMAKPTRIIAHHQGEGHIYWRDDISPESLPPESIKEKGGQGK